ncbi:MAG: permease [SAR86 cluster bacterium BACL1 MAG-120924-bin88]|uniref:Permease n=2 Tax=SAR86 cluster TaxID=62672 RepID=A0A0R2UB90_9GAMM|nr:MAG: permease [SAR86 cluster bacterium BACL1 MAG-120507-bin14]KRO96500.1 MAG: permease [SAR86 cluster bacterium BACL1 MAG-120820-bin45]KRO99412.1 MAG: permease [SAR86 cluster bacterium BACL1 MAG-120823-bin87]KRO99861.1 MAG: permease [SAR86 cluster bacterium BACL1 MAG-120813-bin36]KRP00888.1 MAG: permease [SAR86 cluster bacterium BACL1 MAG-120924-bin88]KRP09773.1 MAG: permease [SAR86 cluster bacterium BACL1 MAG-121004-bin11]KRP14532.1 MAG: permease [SAR86 cluster bacterium BACL1 MAG-121001-
MLEEINNLFKKIFSNEETLVFSILVISAFLILFFLGSILTPFLISIIFAYLLIGMQSRFESYGLKSSIALFLTYSIFLLLGIALMVWLAPLLYQQLQAIVLEVPKWLSSFRLFAQDIPARYPDLVSSDQITVFLESLSGQISTLSQDFIKASIAGIQNTATIAINLILLPILVFFFLCDRETIISGFLSILPKERRMLKNVWVEMDEQLSNYARGKAIEIVIVGVAAAIIFIYFDLEYVALLSVLVGFSVLIPFLGAFIVTIPVAVVGLLQLGLTFEFSLLMASYLALQILDGNLLVPILFSDAVKLHPVAIILAVFVFGSLFGFWGVFFAIPIATLIKAIWNAWPAMLTD